MRNKYNSFEYWQNLISANNTIRGHMLMDKLPTPKSVYIHTIIFSKFNGLKNTWSYFPNEMALLGYIQYSFLQEAFYIWINGREQGISYIPLKPAEEIIKDGEKRSKITSKEAAEMRKQIEKIKKIWLLPKSKIVLEIKKFIREFNKIWYGNNNEFLYLKIFNTPEELGEFVINSSYMSNSEEDFKNKYSETIDDWREICRTAETEKVTGDAFRKILLKYLTEVI